MAEEQNPFQSPAAPVIAPPVVSGGKQQLAERPVRLGAALIDGFVPGVVYGVGAAFGFDPLFGQSQRAPPAPAVGLGVLALLAVFFLLQVFLVSKYSASLGKKLLGIKVVRSNGDPASLGRIVCLRNIVPGLVNWIPVAGTLFGLVDTLAIFRDSHQCLHDNIADTIVVKA